MITHGNKFAELVRLMAQHSPEEGINMSSLEMFGTYRTSDINRRHPNIDLPAIWIVGQGRKTVYAGDQQFDYFPGNIGVMFYPMAVETEIMEASPDAPFLIAGVGIDLIRIADVVTRIERVAGGISKPQAVDPSGVFTLPLTENLLDPLLRLFRLLDNPRDAAMLGDSVVDEIYYRLLVNERGGDLLFLLQQRGEIQRIQQAVAHIHHNVDQPVDVESLAEMVHMSRTSFYENFKRVMHLSPLQYAKSVKLHRAQTLIREGRNASEAGYMVGYNSPAQFSREYKRQFGYAPSAT